MKKVRVIDPEIADALSSELKRQQNNLELIASENFVSEEILEVQGSVLTNKYAEGYPGKRYYGGCQFVDIAETLAIERAKSLFNAEGANVQPHSGTQANLEVYFSVLKPGDTILSMSLDHGGHLSHGSPASLVEKLFRIISYGVKKDTETIDYDLLYELAMKEKPKLIIAGASSYSRIIDFPKFSEIAKASSSLLLTDMAHIAGLVATGLHPSPVPYSDFVTTTTHKTLRGPRGGIIFFKKAYEKKINKSVFPGSQGGPLMHVIAAKAVALKLASEEKFKEYQNQIIKNAKTLAESLKQLDFRIVSGGTDNHLMLVDLRSKNMTGMVAESLLESVGITVNKNVIPYDPLPPDKASGLRLGTPALTTRGMKEREMKEIAQIIDEAIKNMNNNSELEKVKYRVRELSSNFSLYPEISY
ncbi:MAG: Serine hydroxymethyltransferase [candidate division WS2 bacterium]|uniref:Serine hydroxymethyltransferase n=1 Tax=Psychracetigena formicireducens TaxID=2986056 RepID=A0A9E2BIB3_PSYF1|nr:Serine hydroxymethyltransferase [Candidatus Psychracetigena formicireducens]MBT9145594.1 Serine hydroxymethyltransferase [Candidatus Psychracetigena formicireducens]